MRKVSALRQLAEIEAQLPGHGPDAEQHMQEAIDGCSDITE